MKQDLSLYIHIPFCKTICLYCNFLTFAHKNKWIPDYVEAVCKEIASSSKKYNQRVIKSIYFGGGTPSLIESKYIHKILQAISKHYKLEPNLEISIECNPESVNVNKLKDYVKMGINRFSLGIQSFNQETLRRIARPHNRETIFKALEAIKQTKIKNFGADFIMGLPDQTLASFKKEVSTILKYKPTHLSYYFLSYDTKKIDLFIKDCPNDEEQIKYYEYLTRTLKRKGFKHYEVSNYALPGFECIHNQRYWQQKDYLGLGLGAHSIVDGKMWENQKNFEAYLQNPAQIENEMEIDSDLKRMEYIMLSLRTIEGLDLAHYEQEFRHKQDNVQKLLLNAKEYIRSKHLKKEHNHLKATEKGFLILDKITHDLI